MPAAVLVRGGPRVVAVLYIVQLTLAPFLTAFAKDTRQLPRRDICFLAANEFTSAEITLPKQNRELLAVSTVGIINESWGGIIEYLERNNFNKN